MQKTKINNPEANSNEARNNENKNIKSSTPSILSQLLINRDKKATAIGNPENVQITPMSQPMVSVTKLDSSIEVEVTNTPIYIRGGIDDMIARYKNNMPNLIETIKQQQQASLNAVNEALIEYEEEQDEELPNKFSNR